MKSFPRPPMIFSKPEMLSSPPAWLPGALPPPPLVDRQHDLGEGRV